MPIIATLRADRLSAQLPGLGALVSQDTVRHALIALDEQAGGVVDAKTSGCECMARSNAPWIMDVDVTIKALYGRQAR